MRAIRTLASLVLVAAISACGGGGEAPIPVLGQIEFVVQPNDGTFPTQVSVQVRLVDTDGALYTIPHAVGLSLGVNPNAALLDGTLSQVIVDGLGTFQVTLDRGGIGYTLIARAGTLPFVETESAPFNYVGAASTIEVIVPPVVQVGFAIPGLQARIVDAGGNLVTNADRLITLSLDNLSGFMILRASGFVDRILERVDPVGALVYPVLPNNQPTEVSSMTYYFPTGTVIAGDISGAILEIDPVTGLTTVQGNAGAIMRGLAYDQINDLVYGAERFTRNFYTINPSNGSATFLGPILDINGMLTIDKMFGMDYDPITGFLYGVVHVAGDPGRSRSIAQINPDTLLASIGLPMDFDGVAGFAFSPDGTIALAQTGDGTNSGGAVVPETMYQVTDLFNGTMVLIGGLSNGDEGESVATVPPQLLGSLQVQSVNGIANFPSVGVEATGTGYRIRAQAPNLSLGESDTFDATP